jgi:hypothetical protein
MLDVLVGEGVDIDKLSITRDVFIFGEYTLMCWMCKGKRGNGN